MSAKKRAVSAVLAIFVAALTVSALLVTTYALFSDTAETGGGHLSAGTLDISLWQTDMKGTELAADGTMQDYTGFGGAVNLEETEDKVFDLGNVCPGIWREGTFEVRNNGSSSAFVYDVTIRGVRTEGGGASDALKEQVLVTVTGADGNAKQFRLSEINDSGCTVRLGTMYADDESESFSIKVEFPNGENNNDAQGGAVSFDICVTATQLTERQ